MSLREHNFGARLKEHLPQLEDAEALLGGQAGMDSVLLQSSRPWHRSSQEDVQRLPDSSSEK